MSNSATARTPGEPGATGVALSAGDTQIEARWGVPPDNGSPISRYDAEISPGGVHQVHGEAYTVFTGLQNGNVYSVRIRACNAVGCAAWSPRETARPRRPLAITITPSQIPMTAPDCTSTDCRYVQVDADGLEPGRTYSYTCNSSTRGRFGAGTITASADGQYDGEPGCYHGIRGDSVWVTLDSLRSNTIVWRPQ